MKLTGRKTQRLIQALARKNSHLIGPHNWDAVVPVLTPIGVYYDHYVDFEIGQIIIWFFRDTKNNNLYYWDGPGDSNDVPLELMKGYLTVMNDHCRTDPNDALRMLELATL